MIYRLAVVSLWAEDVPAAVHFYRDVIGLPLLPHHGDRPHFDLGGSFLVILHGKPVPPQEPLAERFPVLAVSVPDLDAAAQALRQHQVELTWESDEHTGACWVIFNDPAGNLIELVQF
jgi:catechol 2,3-dioxygenase-like lactoylglutathione lyase family enzyme